MPERFISEPIQAIAGSFDSAWLARGIPGIPRQFFWRGRTFFVTQILRSWRTTGPCRHGSGERYVRRHWFEAQTDAGCTMKLYFEKGNPSNRRETGWYIFTLCEKE